MLVLTFRPQLCFVSANRCGSNALSRTLPRILRPSPLEQQQSHLACRQTQTHAHIHPCTRASCVGGGSTGSDSIDVQSEPQPPHSGTSSHTHTHIYMYTYKIETLEKGYTYPFAVLLLFAISSISHISFLLFFHFTNTLVILFFGLSFVAIPKCFRRSLFCFPKSILCY